MKKLTEIVGRLSVTKTLDNWSANFAWINILIRDRRFYNFVNPINWFGYIHGFRDYLMEIRKDDNGKIR